jgi:uncharacterized protein (TIGR03437 family)
MIFWIASMTSRIAALTLLLFAASLPAQVLVHRSFPAAADFNLDKKLDVIFLDSNGLAVAIGNGDATFRAPVRTAAPQSSCSLAVADFNLDGKPDVATGAGWLFAGKGDGTFAAPVKLAFNLCCSPAPPALVVAADFNQDGKPDLGVGPQCDSPQCAVRVFLGNGDGTFRDPVFLGPDEGDYGIAAGDFNGDGSIDLAVLSFADLQDEPNGARVFVMFGDGHGGFAPARTVFELSAENGGLAAADLNNDGRADLVVGANGSADVFLGNKDGSFMHSYSTTVGNVSTVGIGGSAVAIGDLDGDGSLDLLFGNDFTHISDLSSGPRQTVAWLRGRSDGTFAIRTTSSVPAPIGLAAGDFDGDGVVDAVAVSAIANAFSIFRRAEQSPAVSLISTASGADLMGPGIMTSAYVPALTAGPVVAAPAVLPSSLAGVSVDVVDATGVKLHAGLLGVWPGRVDFQIPANATPGLATLLVHRPDGVDVSTGFLIQRTSPSLFVTFDRTDALIPAAYAVRLEPDGAQTPILAVSCPSTHSLVEPACNLAPITVDERPVYLILYGTGIAGMGPVQCVMDGVSLPVEYAGASAIPAVDQVNVRLPPTPQGGKTIVMRGIALLVDGIPSNAVNVAMR